MLVAQLTRPRSQFNDKQSNQMERHHLSPLILFPAMIMKALKQKTESHFDKRVNTHEGSQSQFNDEQSNQMERHQLSPLILFLTTIMKALKQKNMNLVLTKESTPTNDVSTTVDKTTIPV